MLTTLVVVFSQVHAFETIVTHQTMHFKYMQFIVCQFYLHKPLKRKINIQGQCLSKDPCLGHREAAEDWY